MEQTKIELIEIICDAIRQKHLISFYFESQKGGKDWRKIKPYMIYINENREIKVVGLPHKLWDGPIKDRQPRHYILDKINLKQFEILSETFDDPGVARNMVDSTKKVKIIFRFIYQNEDEQEAMKSWINIKDLRLS
ncbi:hypothetical protein [Segetibacter koreensis]|uniref:hypothetical protein n=1 Tax=Segetibacter koreensis TaxID=398037 RepID=UPI00037D7BEB|nr:hypothetical protein [Segetibacter koreensis]